MLLLSQEHVPPNTHTTTTKPMPPYLCLYCVHQHHTWNRLPSNLVASGIMKTFPSVSSLFCWDWNIGVYHILVYWNIGLCYRLLSCGVSVIRLYKPSSSYLPIVLEELWGYPKCQWPGMGFQICFMPLLAHVHLFKSLRCQLVCSLHGNKPSLADCIPHGMPSTYCLGLILLAFVDPKFIHWQKTLS